MNQNYRSYYAIIPASVRYDNSIKANAKLLYGEITALCNEKGYCWATNSYFSELYNVSKETVSRWISQLESAGYVNTKVIYAEESKEIKERRIYLSRCVDKNVNTYCQSNQYPIDKKVNTPIDKNVKDNSTVFNNTINNKKNSASDDAQRFFEECWKLYPNKKGKGQIKPKTKMTAYKLGDEFIRCIERYKKLKPDWQQFQNGSTFWNGGYVDYLDDVFKDENVSTRTQTNPIEREGSMFE